MINHNRILLVLFIFFLTFYKSQQSKSETYKKISGLMETYDENDEAALVYVNNYISKAKREKNLKK